MMMGLGFLIMLAVLAVPILLIANLVVLVVRPKASKRGEAAPAGGSFPLFTSAAGLCSHCGANLQVEWAHCPHCGAPV